MTLEELVFLGFDESYKSGDSPGYLQVKCSQCSALSINGTPCHETGCPNQGRECFECGCHIPSGQSCDCLDPMEDEEDPSDDD